MRDHDGEYEHDEHEYEIVFDPANDIDDPDATTAVHTFDPAFGYSLTVAKKRDVPRPKYRFDETRRIFFDIIYTKGLPGFYLPHPLPGALK
jgi:hypothetical protein